MITSLKLWKEKKKGGNRSWAVIDSLPTSPLSFLFPFPYSYPSTSVCVFCLHADIHELHDFVPLIPSELSYPANPWYHIIVEKEKKFQIQKEEGGGKRRILNSKIREGTCPASLAVALGN